MQTSNSLTPTLFCCSVFPTSHFFPCLGQTPWSITFIASNFNSLVTPFPSISFNWQSQLCAYPTLHQSAWNVAAAWRHIYLCELVLLCICDHKSEVKPCPYIPSLPLWLFSHITSRTISAFQLWGAFTPSLSINHQYQLLPSLSLCGKFTHLLRK